MIVNIGGEHWRVVHYDTMRGVYTLERARRWFKGRLRVATAMEFARYVL